MAIGIGKSVEDNERPLAAVEDEVLRSIALSKPIAKQTASFFRITFDVSHTPGCPNTLHFEVE
jgi:hypothetical protein